MAISSTAEIIGIIIATELLAIMIILIGILISKNPEKRPDGE